MNAEEVKGAIEAALETARTSAVSVKLPPFWPDKTGLWFAQAEAQFAIKGITVDKTKFSYVVSMLDTKIAVHAMDIIENPPDNDAYGTLKTRLTTTFSITDSEKANRILDMSGLGDKTPSQCLSDMLMLVPKDQEPGFLFRQVFLRLLPVEVQTQLAQSTKTGTKAEDLRGLATEADKYFASAGARISSVSGKSYTDESGSQSVNATSDRQLCFYHRRFGKNAKKCQRPCTWITKLPAPSNTTMSNQGNSQPGRRLSN